MQRVWFLPFAFFFPIACSTPPAAEPPAPEATVRILQFYASPGKIPLGDQALLCYGVENAASVRMEPPVEKLNPALSRCFFVTPRTETEYTLFAKGSGGEEVSRTARVALGAAAGSTERVRPRVLGFYATPTEAAAGAPVTLCFEIEGGQATIDPPVLELGRVTRGCFGINTSQTRTYTLTASSGGQSDRRSVTVKIR